MLTANLLSTQEIRTMPRAHYECKIPGISLILRRQYPALNNFAKCYFIGIYLVLNLAIDDYLTKEKPLRRKELFLSLIC